MISHSKMQDLHQSQTVSAQDMMQESRTGHMKEAVLLRESKCVAGLREKLSHNNTQYYYLDRVYEGDMACSICSVNPNEVGGVADLSFPGSATRRGRVIDKGNTCPTIQTESEICKIESHYAIRKLTPKECFRLMDFDDEDYEAAAEVNTNTQLYKQAGNSIVIAVLENIFSEMLI